MGCSAGRGRSVPRAARPCRGRHDRGRAMGGCPSAPAPPRPCAARGQRPQTASVRRRAWGRKMLSLIVSASPRSVKKRARRGTAQAAGAKRRRPHCYGRKRPQGEGGKGRQEREEKAARRGRKRPQGEGGKATGRGGEPRDKGERPEARERPQSGREKGRKARGKAAGDGEKPRAGAARGRARPRRPLARGAQIRYNGARHAKGACAARGERQR